MNVLKRMESQDSVLFFINKGRNLVLTLLPDHHPRCIYHSICPNISQFICQFWKRLVQDWIEPFHCNPRTRIGVYPFRISYHYSTLHFISVSYPFMDKNTVTFKLTGD